MPPQRTGALALRNGLIFGAILGVLGVGNTLIQWVAGAYHLIGSATNGSSSVSLNDTGAPSLLGCIVFLAMLALTFTAGALTAHGTWQSRLRRDRGTPDRSLWRAHRRHWQRGGDGAPGCAWSVDTAGYRDDTRSG